MLSNPKFYKQTVPAHISVRWKMGKNNPFLNIPGSPQDGLNDMGVSDCEAEVDGEGGDTRDKEDAENLSMLSSPALELASLPLVDSVMLITR